MSNEGVFRMTEKALEMLRLLEKNAAYSNELLADLLNISVAEVTAIRSELEDQAVILGYQTLIDWTKVLNTELVTAMIEVKVTPTRGKGFDQVAERIYRFKEVKALYLMSGGYDLSITIEAQSMMEISRFVSDKLSPLDSVMSTVTHFILKKYKHDGVIFDQENDHDPRMMVTP